LTHKSQEALHDAPAKALRVGHVEVDGEHLLLALLDQPDELVPRLLTATGADPDRVRASVEAELGRRPRVSGPETWGPWWPARSTGASIVARWTGIPVSRLLEGEWYKLLRLDEILHERVMG
jgi:ATP-dependent Clp protease ATP-binding subunit ClpA